MVGKGCGLEDQRRKRRRPAHPKQWLTGYLQEAADTGGVVKAEVLPKEALARGRLQLVKQLFVKSTLLTGK
jgi:hypothetical protein